MILGKKKSEKSKEEQYYVGEQVSEIPASNRDIRPDQSKTADLLRKLEQTNDKYEAIDIIINETPDGKMAFNTYLRIANQGVEIAFKNKVTGRRTKKYDVEFRDFCANMGGNLANGLDGFIDQLHGSSLAHGGMAVEIVVNSKATGIDAILIVDPKTFTEYKWIPEKNRWAIYQKTESGKEKDLYEGNFFWIPNEPLPGSPVGTLQFEPAIETETSYYRHRRDIDAYCERIGFPRYDVSVNIDALLASAPPEVLGDSKKKQKYMEGALSTIKSQLSSIRRDSDMIHYNNVEVKILGGNEAGTGIDVRAMDEMYSPQITNAYQLMPMLLGRLKTGSYSLGTAEYKVVKDSIEVRRRDSKRMIENIGNFWARLNGYNVYCVVTHNPVEWQIIEEKMRAEKLKIERAQLAEELGYTDHESAAVMALGNDANPVDVEKPVKDTKSNKSKQKQEKELEGNTDEEKNQ